MSVCLHKVWGDLDVADITYANIIAHGESSLEENITHICYAWLSRDSNCRLLQEGRQNIPNQQNWIID